MTGAGAFLQMSGNSYAVMIRSVPSLLVSIILDILSFIQVQNKKLLRKYNLLLQKIQMRGYC